MQQTIITLNWKYKYKMQFDNLALVLQIFTGQIVDNRQDFFGMGLPKTVRDSGFFIFVSTKALAFHLIIPIFP